MVKLTKEDKELIEKAKALLKKYDSKRHSVSAILLTKKGEIIDGMSMEFDCGIGVCAERVAMFKMMPKETEIDTIVALCENLILPPWGVCRELMYEMNEKNLNNTWVIISRNNKVRLKELYPHDWKKTFDKRVIV